MASKLEAKPTNTPTEKPAKVPLTEKEKRANFGRRANTINDVLGLQARKIASLLKAKDAAGSEAQRAAFIGACEKRLGELSAALRSEAPNKTSAIPME